MNQQTFSSLFKDLISRLYDQVAVETHPLAGSFPAPQKATQRRAEAIQQLILAEIEHLRPDEKEAQMQSPEWRPYLILRQRYADGLDPRAIAGALFIGDRQFRRDHSRALQSLSARIWQMLFAAEQTQPETGETSQPDFELHPEALDLNEITQGVLDVAHRRLESENIIIDLRLSPGPLPVHTDRVLLRQILLSLLNYIMHLRGAPNLYISTNNTETPVIQLEMESDEQWNHAQNDEQDSLQFVRRLSQRLPARLEEHYPPPGASGRTHLRLIFSAAGRKTLLVIDDQPAALKMFQRYLSRTTLEVIGLNDPTLALATVQQIRPALIVLDVMMPRVDGWEVLQALQLDPLTRHIPILVCSAWAEPQLAHSLGASAFLKKPVIQKELLEAVTRLGLLE